jgi:hypothetical protein
MERILIRVCVRSSDGSCNEERTVRTIEQTETTSEVGTSSGDSSGAPNPSIRGQVSARCSCLFLVCDYSHC